MFAASQQPGVCGAEICLSDSRSFHSRRGARATLLLIDTLDIATENGLVRIGGENGGGDGKRHSLGEQLVETHPREGAF